MPRVSGPIPRALSSFPGEKQFLKE